MISYGQCFLYGVILLNIFACNESSKEISASFYHWKTAWAPQHTELATVNALAVKKLYIKFFDVDWEVGKAHPKAVFQVNELNRSSLDSFEIIPTIFITNNTLKHYTPATVNELANKIYTKIKALLNANDLIMNELQLDCDWTESTRETYFALLNTLKENMDEGMVLAATIRLHQVKYPDKTGIPPVDRGVLMYYNMGEVMNWEEPNSILNNAIGAKYLEALPTYPLKLDLALPIFAWAVLFRDGKMIRLINDCRSSDLQDTLRFEKIAPNRYEVLQSTYLNGYYLYLGDKIRLEYCTSNDLFAAANALAPKMPREAFTVIFYHLDGSNLEAFPSEELKKIIHAFY